MLITLSRCTTICQSVAEVKLTGVVSLEAVTHNLFFFKFNNNNLLLLLLLYYYYYYSKTWSLSLREGRRIMVGLIET